ncbi:MAG: collagen-like protein [Chthonomonadetes bacterium]|nr:collagen-like protein [Chthonomonadetes bacterium]
MPRYSIWRVTLVAILAVIGTATAALAQGTPFNILRPADGAIVRERVRIEVPRASIPQGGYVGIYIDGRFQTSLAPRQDDKEPRLRYIWDTKVPIVDPSTQKPEPVQDGEHTITVVLYDPEGRAMDRAEVRVQVANREGINLPAMGTRLQYRFRLGENVNYKQHDEVILLAGQTGAEITGGVTGEQVAYEADTFFNLFVYDIRGSQYIIRQRANKQQVLAYNQPVYTLGKEMFRAVLQFVTPLGSVVYQNVDTTNDPYVFRVMVLPILPELRVKPGDTWSSWAHILLPDMPVERARKVLAQNKLEGVEWEGGYPTVKITQTYEGTLSGTLEFSNYVLEKPKVKLNRTLWFAFNAGRLVRSESTIEIEGQVPTGAQPARLAGMMGGMPGAPMMGAPTMGGGAPYSPYAGYGAPMGGMGGGISEDVRGMRSRRGAAGVPGIPGAGARTGATSYGAPPGVPGVPGAPMMGPTSGAPGIGGRTARGGFPGIPGVPGMPGMRGGLRTPGPMQAREQAPLKLKVVQSVQLLQQ